MKRLAGYFVPKAFTDEDFIPEFIDGIPTDVIDGGVFTPISGTRPHGGDQISASGTTPDKPGGATTSSPGTLGCGVLNKYSRRERYLTCSHVLTFLPKNESPAIRSDRDILNADGSVVGTITAEEGQNGNWAYGPIVDCAAITPTDPRKNRRVPVRETTDQQPRDMDFVREEDEINSTEVWTRGAITGQRRTGTIININAAPALRDGTTAARQILIRPSGGGVFAVPGDSGAIVCRKELAIGIVRAVNDAGIVAVCPIKTTDKQGVADLLNLRFGGFIRE